MIFLNAADDPIVPPSLWEPVRDLTIRHPEMAFILTKHGGHLGFLEGTSYTPKSVTWLDRMIIEVANSAIRIYGAKKHAEAGFSCSP